MAGVSFRHVYKRFGDVSVIKDFNLEVADKEFMVFVGPSGCGKSTNLRMLAGLEEISEGDILIGDRVVNDVPPKDRDIAMVFQSYALYPHMSVYDNMAFGLKLRKMPKAEIDRRVKEASDILGLGNLLDRKPKALSGGQRQRVAVGRAIVREPDVFLMDEPLSNLDAKLRAQTRAELIDLHERLGGTVVYVTHDQIEAMTMADRVAIMANGALHQVGTPDDVYDRPANTFVAGFIGTPPMNLMDGVATSDGVEVAGAKLDATHQLAVGAPVVVGIRPEHLVLSDDGLAMEVKAVEWLGYESLITADLVDVGAAQRSARGDGDTNEDSGTIGTASLVGDAVVDANDPEQVGATRRRVILRANGRVDARNGKIIRATPQAGAVQLFDADTGVHL